MAKLKLNSSDLKLFSLAGLIICLDQISKYWARNYYWAQLNQGGVFGLLPGWNWSLFSFLILIGLMLNLVLNHHQNRRYRIGWCIIMAAGLSNMIDRLVFEGVWDWIYYPVINVVGNIADVLLGVGILILVLPWRKVNKLKTEIN